MNKWVALFSVVFLIGCTIPHIKASTPVEDIKTVDSSYWLVYNGETGKLDMIKPIHLNNHRLKVTYTLDSLVEELLVNSNLDIGTQGFPFEVMEANMDTVLGRYFNQNKGDREYILVLILAVPEKGKLLNITHGVPNFVELSFNKKIMRKLETYLKGYKNEYYFN